MSTHYRTEDDLRAAFRAEAAEVHAEAAPLLIPSRRPTSTARATARRWAVPVAAAAAMAVIAGSFVFVRDGHESAPAAVQLTGAPLAFTFTVASVPGWQITPNAIHATYQDAMIARDNVDAFGDVTVSNPGAFDPGPIEGGEHVTINGHQGYFGAIVPINSAQDNGGSDVGSANSLKVGPPVPTVAWQIAPDQWATVTVPGQIVGGKHLDVRAVQLQIARAVSLIAPTPMRLPFRTGWLPADARRVASAASSAPPSPNWSTTIQFGSTGGSLGVSEYAVSSGARKPDDPFEPNTTIAGHPAQYAPRLGDPGALHDSRHGGSGTTHLITPASPAAMPPMPHWPSLTVELGGDVWLQVKGDYSQADLMHVAESLALSSNPSDPNTWFDQD